MALMFAICNPQPNWMPRKPKLMFQICQKLRSGLRKCVTVFDLTSSVCDVLMSFFLLAGSESCEPQNTGADRACIHADANYIPDFIARKHSTPEGYAAMSITELS
jgi:hypothetical protein